MTRTIVVCSGGMDSVTLAYMLADAGDELYLLGFDYGQRHYKELDYLSTCAHDLKVPFAIVNLENLGAHLGGSALTDAEIDVPEGHYAAENMKSTVVPNRNMIMLSIATGVAVAQKADRVATAVHAGDHAIYPDCRPEFITAMTRTVRTANEGFINPLFTIEAPFVAIGKHDIARIGAALKVPYELTWSCYNGRDLHCGKCGTCVERKEAFTLAEVEDPTEYE